MAKFNFSDKKYDHLEEFLKNDVMDVGYKTVEKIALDLDPCEMKEFDPKAGEDEDGAYPRSGIKYD